MLVDGEIHAKAFLYVFATCENQFEMFWQKNVKLFILQHIIKNLLSIASM